MSRLGTIFGRKIRLGIVGCGMVAEKHFHALEQHRDNIDLVSVCDTTAERVEKAAERMSSRPYMDLEGMLDTEKLDIVTVATPNGHHPHHVKLIADRHIHVITEKPMAIDLADGREMLEYCKQKDVELCVIYQNRLNDACQAIKHAHLEQRFGKIYLMSSNVFWARPEAYYGQPGDWRGSKDLDGGAFYTQASHYIDFMSWIAGGFPRNVYANLKTLERNIETEDTGVVSIEWDNGVLGSMSMTMLTYPKNLEGSVTILGEKGTAKIGGVAMTEIQHWDFSDTHPDDKDIASNNYKTENPYTFGHARYYDGIVRSFRGEKGALITADEGVKSLVLLEAIKRSSATGRSCGVGEI